MRVTQIMILPINFDELSILFATIAIIFFTSEMMLKSHRKILVNKRRLRTAATIFSILFLITISIRVINIIMNITV
jgi:hypothetical protein